MNWPWSKKEAPSEKEEGHTVCPKCGNTATLDITAMSDDAPQRLCGACGLNWAAGCPDKP